MSEEDNHHEQHQVHIQDQNQGHAQDQHQDINQDFTQEQNQPPSDLDLFIHACQEGELDTVQNLISTDAVGVNETKDDGITGLHWACINNRLKVVKALIENGADPNIKGGELNATPLHWACRNGLVYIVDYLISNTLADPNLRDAQEYNALHLAVHSSNIMLVAYLLASCCDENSTKKIYVDEPDGSNRTALHWASYQNDIFSIVALLKYGADVTKIDDQQFTPLHWSFMRGYKNVMKTLLEAGSDIHVKNDQNKDSFGVAQDMDCLFTWKKVLLECGRDPKNDWKLRENWIQPRMGKIITFLAPYIFLPAALAICTTSTGLAFPKLFLAVSLFAGGIFLIKRFIISTYIYGDNELPKSPILAGIFSATAFWCIIVWLTRILPSIVLKNFIANVLLGVVITVFVWSFFKAMFINPGFVPIPTDNAVVYQQMKDLISLGKFDTDHFCVNTFMRKPLRSRFSKHNKKLVARFDHYCPWIYNEVGVRNHKLFITFVYALNVAILLFTYLSIKYFDYLKDKSGYDSDDEENESFFCSLLGDDLCYGYKNHQFHFNLIAWCLMQYIWIAFLCVVQTFQILKGLTTWELSSLNSRAASRHRFNHATVPDTFENAGNAPSTTMSMNHKHKDFQTCLHLLGIDQFVLTVKMSIASIFKKDSQTQYDPLHIVIPTDYGMKQNWLDFWVIGEIKWRNVFFLPIDGENNLNGKVVDYYKLYEYPSKDPGSSV